jgi:hypothetical protein
VAIQEAIRLALESYGLAVKLVDKGFDYEVGFPRDNELEEAAIRFEVGTYLVEVKATTKGGARLTPTQAETASAQSSRYVRCVVDLRAFPGDPLDTEWTTASAEPLAKFVSDIGSEVKATWMLVDEAKSRSVGIRNESALRYEVPASVWETGISMREWVERISKRLSGGR